MTTRTRPYNVKQSDLRPEWHVVDAEGKTLGRVSTEIATLLQGKHKPTYTPHLAAGDFVVVVNAAKFRVSGNKRTDKIYYRHSGYHGGLTEQTLEELLEKHPTRALKQAVKGMLPKNIRGKHMLSRLKLYEGDEHPHQAQVNASKAQAAPVEAPAPARPAKVEPEPEPAPEPQAELEQAEAAAETVVEEQPAEEPGVGEEPTETEQMQAEAGEEDLEALTVPRLRELAKERSVPVPSRARKADIIEAIRSGESD